MNSKKMEQRENSFLCCQKSLRNRLWCRARYMARFFDFGHDWRRHIGPCMLPKRHGQHHRLHSHTWTRRFLWTLSLCHSQRAVGCSRPAPCSQDVGSGPGPEGRKYRGGLASPLGDAIGPTIWPVSLSLNWPWPLYCLVVKQPSKGERAYREWEREDREEGGGCMY